jgi:hypothetical protein
MEVLNSTCFFLLVILFISICNSIVYNGSASCYGDYQNILLGGSIVQSGIGNYITGVQFNQLEYQFIYDKSPVNSYLTGEDFRYTSAMCNTWANTNAGACFRVSCLGGRTANMNCKPGYV